MDNTVRNKILPEKLSALTTQIFCMSPALKTIPSVAYIHWPELQSTDVCCYEKSSEGKDVTGRMIRQNYVGCSLALSVCAVWFSLQDSHFFATYFVVN
jgi:hypothetical protein